MAKLISIVVCTYNGEAYLAEVLEAILVQEEIDNIIEKVIVVDNASKDRTKEIVFKFIKDYPIIEYIYEPTPGVTHARKHSAYVNTDWVAYIDDDNVIEQGWVKEAKKYIQENPNVGVFNGATIPQIRHTANQQQIIMLKAIYPYLACTHYDMEEYKNNVLPRLKAPFGAGMVLRSQQLKEFADEGWTHNEGRKGGSLGSGEDGEIAAAVLRKGFDYGFNNNMVVHHIIPEFRLEVKYVNKLLEGLDAGFYSYISYKDYYIFYRIRTLLKSLGLIPIMLAKRQFLKDPVSRLMLKHGITSRKRLLIFTLKDFLFIRK